MALIYLYEQFADGDTFTENQIKITNRARDISYTERLCDVGEFSFSLPVEDDFCGYVQSGRLVAIDGEFWGIIRQAQQMQDGIQEYVTVSGEDLKGWLAQRITVYPAETIAEGLQGYDAINSATTETIVKYFVANNAVSPADPKRRIPMLVNATDQQRGKADDQYMSRFEILTDVCKKNLEPLGYGYRITPNKELNRFEFDLTVGNDRTEGQYDNPRVLFDGQLKNMLGYEYYMSDKSTRNAFYASLSKSKNEAETLTCIYYRDEEGESSGTDRYEQHLNVSVNLPEDQMYDALKEYALKDAEEYRRVETITVSALDRYQYGKDYDIGDTVTVQIRWGLFGNRIAAMDCQITAITHTWGVGGVRRELSFGEGKISRFDVLRREILNQ